MEKCNNCGKTLEKRDWPFIYRCFGELCLSCKQKAEVIFEKNSRLKINEHHERKSL
jgi:hypothetical protein